MKIFRGPTQKYFKNFLRFKKKSIFQGIGSRRIRSFPINCTLLLKTIFQKNILWFFFKGPKSRHKNFKVFWKKSNFRILDLGELSHFLSIAPHFFFIKKSLWGLFWGPLGAPKKFKILVNVKADGERNRISVEQNQERLDQWWFAPSMTLNTSGGEFFSKRDALPALEILSCSSSPTLSPKGPLPKKGCIGLAVLLLGFCNIVRREPNRLCPDIY